MACRFAFFVPVLVKVGGPCAIAYLAALTTSFQFYYLFFRTSDRDLISNHISNHIGWTMAIGIIASFLLAPVIFQRVKGRPQTYKYDAQNALSELSQARLAAAIIGGIIAFIYLFYDYDIAEEIKLLIASILLVFPLYGFFQWVLYRTNALAGWKLIALTGITGSIIPAPIIPGKEAVFNLNELVFISLIGMIGFGLAFYLARRLRLYA